MTGIDGVFLTRNATIWSVAVQHPLRVLEVCCADLFSLDMAKKVVIEGPGQRFSVDLQRLEALADLDVGKGLY